jgi:hypothetical protein
MAAYSLSVRIRNSYVSSDPHESAGGAWSTRVETAAVGPNSQRYVADP